MLKNFLLSFTLLISSWVIGQNTDISGVINSYQPVNEINSDILIVDSTTEFEEDNLVLLIQMQGAQMNESNSNQFGDVINLNSVGNYEFVRICEIISDSEIRIIPPERSYDTNGIVQIITVPYYENATVTSTLTSSPWNGNTGGVLVFQCESDLTLNADIDVSGKGFRGGNINTSDYFCSWLFNVNDYFYDINTGEGAEKGEGIAFYITNKTSGRGAQVNGGGGGNDHNSGGGGGSNAGLGGQGGERISPATFACSGANPGIGGKLLDYSILNNRIYLGGGGGSGHENNANTATPGSNGGGIVILQTNKITSNSYSILANGQDIEIPSEDGSGGGGAGGTVLLDVQEYSDLLEINISGADGGDVSNVGSSNCNGPGGGGGGGLLWVSDSELSPNILLIDNGGEAGTTISATQDNCTVGSTNSATSGANGLILTELELSETECMNEVFSSVYEICETDSIFAGGAWQNETGYYYDEVPFGCCASILESVVEVSSSISETLNETICYGDSLVVNGNSYTSSVMGALETLINEEGCDTLLTINLTVLQESSGIETIEACQEYTWIDGVTYTESNTSASYLIPNGSISGCDSTAYLNLTINTIDITLTQDEVSLTANQDEAEYQWLDCENNFLPIEGATEQTYTTSITGSFQVEITIENCSDTSECLFINIIGVNELNSKSEFIVYPNPTNGHFDVDLGTEKETISAVLRNENGQLIQERVFKNKRILSFDIEGASGVYVLELWVSPTEKTTLKIQKN